MFMLYESMAWTCLFLSKGIPVPLHWNSVSSTLFHVVCYSGELKVEVKYIKTSNMKKIILYIAASLDQCIAEPDGSLEWLTGVPNPQKTNGEYKDLLASVDTILIGGRAYRELLNMDVIWPYKEQMTYVISRHNWGDEDNVRFITNDIIETVSALRNEAGKNILLAGGGELTSMLLAADLIDEMQITYIPIILGKGIPLFSEQPKESKWELIENTAHKSDALTVKYRKRNYL